MLDVFLSSDQDEFEKERKEIAKFICKIQFLECKPLEQRGASYDDVKASSLRAAKNCDIYIGIFGKEFSELTIAEFEEAWKYRKPCLAYVKNLYKSEKRNDKLENFINKDLKPKVKYHLFRGRKKLYNQITNDLKILLMDIFYRGLEDINKNKQKAQSIANKLESDLESRITIPEEEKSRQLISNSMDFINQGKNIDGIVSAFISVERLLRTILKDSIPSKSKIFDKAGLGFLAREALEIGLINQSNFLELDKITMIRNRLFHEGYMPRSYEIKILLDSSQNIIDVLSKAKIIPGMIFTDDFELENINAKPSKWEVFEESGEILISNKNRGAEGTRKYVIISSPFGSRDFIRRRFEPQKKLDLTYYIKQEKYGSSGVGASFHLFHQNKEAIWMAISSKILSYYSDKKYYPIQLIELDEWYKIRVNTDCSKGIFQCYVNDILIIKNGIFRNKVPTIDNIKSSPWTRQDFWSTSIDQIKISSIDTS